MVSAWLSISDRAIVLGSVLFLSLRLGLVALATRLGPELTTLTREFLVVVPSQDDLPVVLLDLLLALEA